MKDTLTHDYLQYPIPAFNSSIAVSALPVLCLYSACVLPVPCPCFGGDAFTCLLLPPCSACQPDGPGADDAGLTCVALTVSGDPWSEVQRKRKRAVSRGGTKVCDSWPASLAC
jgi:hypothetical protein